MGVSFRRVASPLRLVGRLTVPALVLLVQWLLVRIPTMDRSDFEKYAAELERTARWRYGYLVQHHGAWIVRTRMDAHAPAFQPPPADDPLSRVMARELREGPWKASAELAFYAVLFTLYRCSRSRLHRLRILPAAPRLWHASAVALAAGVLVAAAMAPYLLSGYGEPLFSNCYGPGAITCTSLVPATAQPARSAVSYGLLLQGLLWWPLMATDWAAEPLSAALGIRGSLGCVATLFWCAVGALVGASLYGRTPSGSAAA
jgi:hypothetical protein